MRRVLAPLCGHCIGERMRWLDTTPQGLFPELAFVTQANAAYSFTPRGVADGLRYRAERWRRTVGFQMQLIADGCRAGVHADVSEAAARPVPRRIEVVQLDLFDLADAA